MATDDESLKALRDAVSALPENPALRRELASALLPRGQFEEAAGHLDEALQRAPGDGATLLLYARALFELGRYPEALARYEAAVAADVRLADAVLRDRISRAPGDPRARIRLVAATSDGGEGATPLELPRPDAAGDKITFADVGGLDELKEKVRLRVIYPLRRPEVYAAYGKKSGGGVLFYGPPGCGKTHLARATAGEAGLSFMAIGVEDVLDMWLGQSEKRLHEVFEQARSQAPTVLFFDEVDALGGRRSGLRHESYRTLVSQFLSELDGAGGAKLEGVLVLGATNAPWDIDPAFRRPGRFADVLFVPPPDLRARVEILKLKLRGKPQKDVDVAEVARKLDLYSGADLGHIVDSAIEEVLKTALSSGGIQPLTTSGLLTAAVRVKPTTKEWFASAKNFVAYANQSGQYDEVGEYMRRFKLG